MIEIPRPGADLVLVEDGEQLRALYGRSGSRSGEQIVVLTPSAEYAAERAGIPHVPITALYSESELFRSASENVSHVDAFCRRVDELLIHTNSPEASALEGFSAFDLFLWLRILFDSTLSRSFCLESTIRNVKPERITYFRARAEHVRDDLLFRDRTLTPAVVHELAERLGIAVRQLDPPSARSTGPVQRRQWRSLMTRARDGVSYLRWSVVGAGREDGGVTLIPISEGYDLGPTIREWRRRRLALVPYRAVRWKLRDAPKAARTRLTHVGQSILDQIQRDQQLHKLFTFGAVQALHVVQTRLEHLFLRMVPRLAGLIERARALLSETRGGLVVGTPALALPQVAVLVAARSLGMPTVLYQHGGGYGLLEMPMVEDHELALADHFLCYGPKVAELYHSVSRVDRRPSARPRASLLPVGSAALDELRTRAGAAAPPRRSVDGIRTVVYVVTNFSSDVEYFDYRTYPDLPYWRLQKEVVLRCARRRNIRLLIKLHPSDGVSHPMSELVRDRGLANCEVLVATPFTDLLDVADLFVIDYPSSTSLLQALTTDRKIIALADAKYTRPYPRAVELLRNRLVLATSSDEFLHRIDATLDEPDWSLPEPIDNEFLHAYGTGADGNSSSRAIEALLGIRASRGSHLAKLNVHEVTTA